MKIEKIEAIIAERELNGRRNGYRYKVAMRDPSSRKTLLRMTNVVSGRRRWREPERA